METVALDAVPATVVASERRSRCAPPRPPGADGRWLPRSGSASSSVILGGWQLAADREWSDPFFFSQPTAVAMRFWTWVTEGTAQGPLWYEAGVTLEETGIGRLIGAVAGVICRVILGRNRLMADVFSIKVANAVPRVVLGSIFITARGLDMASKVALAMVMVFFVVFGNAFQGVREADRAMIANTMILGASPWRVTRAVVIPSAMRWILASPHVSFGSALVGAVVASSWAPATASDS